MIHNRTQELSKFLTATSKTLGQWWDQDIRRSAYTEGAAFEVNNMIASSGIEVKNPKDSFNRIKNLVSVVEPESHPAISKAQKPVSKIIIGEAELDQFGSELQNQLVPAFEAKTQKIHQLEMNQVWNRV